MKEKNLCDDCLYHFATCAPGKVVFGIDKYPNARGADADRVIECERYRPTTRNIAADGAAKEGRWQYRGLKKLQKGTN